MRLIQLNKNSCGVFRVPPAVVFIHFLAGYSFHVLTKGGENAAPSWSNPVFLRLLLPSDLFSFLSFPVLFYLQVAQAQDVPPPPSMQFSLVVS